ncbi:MAG: metal ABC transporter substrate-binding protein [Actinomycetes bacterium]
MRRTAVLALPLSAALLAGCASDDGADAATDAAGGEEAQRLDVLVGLYPYQFVAERVGGDDVAVENVTPPGVEPHDVELSPQQVGAVGEADLVLISPTFSPALDEAVEQQRPAAVLDVLSVVDVRESGEEEAHGDEEVHADEEAAHGEEGHDHGGEDPHVWLDPTRLATIADAVADELAELAPERADAFRERAAALRAELEELDGELEQGLAQCERRDVVTSHDAFGYLTERYGLDQVPVSGLSPEEEPSPRRLAEVATTAKERGVTTVFFEETVSPRVAEQLAREVGAKAEVLSPLEAPPEDGDYLSAMRANLAALQEALDCT